MNPSAQALTAAAIVAATLLIVVWRLRRAAHRACGGGCGRCGGVSPTPSAPGAAPRD